MKTRIQELCQKIKARHPEQVFLAKNFSVRDLIDTLEDIEYDRVMDEMVRASFDVD